MSYPPPQQPGYPPNYPYNNPPPAQGINYQQPVPQQGYYQQGQPQGYYQQGQPQGYYQQGNVQMNYGQQTVYQQQTAVVTQPKTQPLSSLQFVQVPTLVQCTHCNSIVKTKVSRKIGNTTFICCAIMSLVCCCCCPFCMDCTKDAEHQCPSCKNHLGLFKQPVVQSGGGSGSRSNYDTAYATGPGDDGCGRGPVDYGGGGGGGDDGGGGGGGGDGGGGD